MEPGAAADVAGALYGMGCYEVSMCDTIGFGTPATVTAMFQVGAEVSYLCAFEHSRPICWVPSASQVSQMFYQNSFKFKRCVLQLLIAGSNVLAPAAKNSLACSTTRLTRSANQ